MNWIDKKYRDQLKEREFPESVKAKGWNEAQGLLGEEFPLPPGTAGRRMGYWRFGLGALIGIAALTGILWLSNGGEDAQVSELEYYVPRTEAEINRNSPEALEINSTSLARSPGDLAPVQKIASQLMADDGEHNTNGVSAEKAEGAAGESTANVSAGFASEDSDAEQDRKTGASRSDENQNAVQGPSEVTAVPGEAEISEMPEEKGLAGSSPRALAHEQKHQQNTDPEGSSAKSADKNAPSGESPAAHDGDAGKGVLSDLNEMDSSAISAQQPENHDEAMESDSLIVEDTQVFPVENPAEEMPEVAAEELKSEDWHLAFPPISGEELRSEKPLPSLSGRRFAVSLWGGYAYTGKILQSENQSYLEKREAEEEPVWTLPTGVDIDYFLDGNWTFGTGISWSEYGENLNYEFVSTDSAFFDGRYNSPKEYNNIISVDSVRVIDSINRGHWNYHVVYQQRDTAAEENNGRTSFRYIEIPLMLGYRFGSGRLKPWIRTGVSLGIPVQTSYRYVNSSVSGLMAEGAQSRVAPVQWSYLLNLGIDYKIARHWSVRLNARSSIQLNPVIRDPVVQQRYYRIGGSFGVAYHF